MPFFKKQNQRTGRQNSPVWRMSPSGRGEDIRKGGQRVNMVEIFFTYVYK
jgi:hypothetical protein